MERMSSRRSAIIYKISKIVETKRIIRRWNKLAYIHGVIIGIKQMLSMRFSYCYDEGVQDKISGDSESTSGGVPGDVSLAVYVGKEVEVLERIVLPVAYLSHPLILKLLHNAEEEFAFNYPNGRLTIPCDPALFAPIIDGVRHNGNHHHGVDIGHRLA
jgi:SAUR family protein